MTERAVFYQLTHKFVNNDASIPENAQQVIYYSLAIGHHVGVMDCFTSLLEIPMDDFHTWLTRLPEGDGRRKLEGIIKWGEIEINCEHTDEIFSALKAGLPKMTDQETAWAHTLIRCFDEMQAEPALYLMVRKRE